MKNDMIEKSNLFQYTFYDNSGKLNVVLNVEYIILRFLCIFKLGSEFYE